MFLLCVGALLGGLAAPVGADTYSIVLGGETYRALATPTEIQGVAYVPLGTLVRQWGGVVELRPAWVQLELNGATVVGGVNDSQITAGDQRFGLLHPLVRRDDDVLVAVGDLPRLVVSGFGAAMETPAGAPGLPPVPPPRPIVDLQPTAPPTLPEEDDAALLAPMAPPTPGTEMEPATPEPDHVPEAAPAATAPVGAALRLVVIDPGHGGGDSGVVSAAELAEKDLTLALATRLASALRERTALEVRLTRDSDRDLSPRERAALAGRESGTLLISLHAGAAHAPQASGIDVFHPGPPVIDTTARGVRSAGESPRDVSRDSRFYGEAIASRLAAATESPLRGVREARLRLFHEIAVPALLIEVGCLTNPAEAALLAQESYQARIAQGIADGLADAIANMPGGGAR